MALLPGMMVTPSVRLAEKIGEGGMGSVWVADHLSLRTRVAVKFITPELFQQSPDLAKRFGREATTWRRRSRERTDSRLGRDHGRAAAGAERNCQGSQA
ncbi:MAG: hypothetical protein HY744_08050 [Deltaproteobacteria bacterium]|nr:hypothetical protein [Deltaproteobacteria bacterium]